MRRAFVVYCCALGLAVAVTGGQPTVLSAQTQPAPTTMHKAVTCADTVTELVAANENRQGMAVYNNSSSTVFVGSGKPSALTTSNGLPLVAGASLSFGPSRDGLSCIVSAGTANTRVMETFR